MDIVTTKHSQKKQNQLRGLSNVQPLQLPDLEAETEELRSSDIE